jgi:hypothetical protein
MMILGGGGGGGRFCRNLDESFAMFCISMWPGYCQ